MVEGIGAVPDRVHLLHLGFRVSGFRVWGLGVYQRRLSVPPLCERPLSIELFSTVLKSKEVPLLL